MSKTPSHLRRRQITEAIFAVLRERSVGKTMCPSEVLPLRLRKNKLQMQRVRAVAVSLAKQNKLEIVQGGKKVNLSAWSGPIRLRLPKSLVPFAYAGIDFRKQPAAYRVARGEQGVLTVEPYKSEILPHWRFKTPAVALQSSKTILALFRRYKRAKDFVGMDMARKFLQMGYTRSRRYANHASGRKYIGAVPVHMQGRSGAHGRAVAPIARDAEKARSAEIFKAAWKKVDSDKIYAKLKADWKHNFG